MEISKKYLDELTYRVIGCAIEVHKQIGPGLIESVYEKCFTRELALKGLHYKQQLSVPLEYKGLDTKLPLDRLFNIHSSFFLASYPLKPLRKKRQLVIQQKYLLRFLKPCSSRRKFISSS